MGWKDSISQVVGTASLSDISNFTFEKKIPKKSAIDIFYEDSRSIITQTPTTINYTDWEGALSSIALISITENFFRNILGNILNICPISKKNATEQTINLGSALWHPIGLIEKGAFEHISFSDSKKIIEITKKYTGVDLNNGSFTSLFQEYSKVCELRHSIVHSNRQIAGKNALLLDIPSSSKIIKSGIGYSQLQEIALICNNLVIAYNKKLFETLSHFWATKYRNLSNWLPENEEQIFKEIWFTFFSKIDKRENNIQDSMTYKRVIKELKTEYNL